MQVIADDQIHVRQMHGLKLDHLGPAAWVKRSDDTLKSLAAGEFGF
jgi:hypothetical protein